MPTVRYTTVNGEVLAEKRGGVRRFYVPDPLGSTVALLDSSQAKTDTFTYWPYGEVKTRTGTTPTPLQYVGTQGYYRDKINRVYVRARHLRVDHGRWQTSGVGILVSYFFDAPAWIKNQRPPRRPKPQPPWYPPGDPASCGKNKNKAIGIVKVYCGLVRTPQGRDRIAQCLASIGFSKGSEELKRHLKCMTDWCNPQIGYWFCNDCSGHFEGSIECGEAHENVGAEGCGIQICNNSFKPGHGCCSEFVHAGLIGHELGHCCMAKNFSHDLIYKLGDCIAEWVLKMNISM